jgi:DNA-binding transcriptional ArsR family regulator
MTPKWGQMPLGRLKSDNVAQTSPVLDEPALIRALSHPLRARILHELGEGKASPNELAQRFDAPLGNVAYHVRVLSDMGLIKLVKKTPRRGAIEHHYVAVRDVHIDDAAWGKTDGIVKQRMLQTVLAEVGRYVTDAATMGGFDRDDAHLTRTRLVLDGQAWAELAELLKNVMRRANELNTESQERLAQADHEGELRAALVMMMFESRPTVPDAEAADNGTLEAAKEAEAEGRLR